MQQYIYISAWLNQSHIQLELPYYDLSAERFHKIGLGIINSSVT